MFHLKYPRVRGYFSWDELGCLARSLGFPVGLFRIHVNDEINCDDKGISVQELERMFEYKLLYKALHLTQNLHTADWNSCVIRRCVKILEHHALTYEDIYNARVAYQAYEAGDMKGMVLNQQVMMRTLKMCGKTISPMKLMHRIKHSKGLYDEPGRIQLYEFIDLILWADVYEKYTPDSTFGHFEMHNDMFKLTDFDKLLSHHDERLANRLNAQYLQEEWQFPEVSMGEKSRKYKEEAVVCGDSRVALTAHQKRSYRHLRSEVVRSEKEVHCIKGGTVRERPITAPNLSMYSRRESEAFKRKQSLRAQSAIYSKIQDLLQHVYNKDKNGTIDPVDLSDKPTPVEHKRAETPQVVTQTDVEDTVNYLDRLLFDIETEEGRYEIARDTQMDVYIPKYKQKKEEADIKKAEEQANKTAKSPRTPRKNNRYEDGVISLAYPTPRLPPSHAKRCDARFRGWYGVRSKKGPHYILMSPYFHDSPKGQLFRKLAKMSDAEIKQIHGEFVHRKTKQEEVTQRPVTAPAVMSMGEYKTRMAQKSESTSRNSKLSSGYSSMEDTSTMPDSMPPLPSVPQPLAPMNNNINIEFSQEARREESRRAFEKMELFSGKVSTIPEESEALSEVQRSPIVESGIESELNGIDEGFESPLSEKLQRLSVDNGQQRNGGTSRAKSAYVQRADQLANGRDDLHQKAEDGRRSRSKSALGDSRMDRPLEEIAPMPHMVHSKAKVISVGSIGKVSLLESITESKFWEDLALEQDSQKQKQNKLDNEIHEEDRKSPVEVVAEVNKDGYGSEAVDGEEDHNEAECVDEYVEQRISSQQKKKTKSKSRTPDDIEDEGDIIALILEEEKRRRRLKTSAVIHRNGRQFCSSAKSSSSSSTASSHRQRIGSSTSQSSKSSAAKEVADDKPEKADDNSKQNQSYPLQHKSLLKGEKSERTGKKHVTVRSMSDIRKESLRPPTKYDGLIKRLGNDMTPYLKKQMLRVAAS